VPLPAGLVAPMDDNRIEMRRYLRLATLIREEIANGLLAPGSSVPSIKSLCQVHGISRQTAGKALRMLESEGLTYRVPGLGYFVMSPAEQPHDVRELRPATPDRSYSPHDS
jgi:GntR family transcriptional regulator